MGRERRFRPAKLRAFVPSPRAGRGARGAPLVLAAMSALAALGASGPAAAETWRSLPPFELSAYRFASECRDASGAFLNPAGLAQGKGTNLYLDVSGDGGEILEGTAALQGGSWAFAYRHRDLGTGDGVSPLGLGAAGVGNADTYLFAAGFGPPRYQLGISRAWTNVDLSGEDASTWNAGFLSRPSPRVTLGVLAENLQNPRFLDGRLHPRYTYALSLALLPSDPGRLVFSAQGSHEDGAADRIDLSGGVRMQFRSGVDVGVVVRDRFGEDLEFGGSITCAFARGTVSGRARSVSETDQARGQVALQLFDQFWQRAHGVEPQTPRGPRRPKPRHP